MNAISQPALPSRPIRCLIVEDDPGFAQMLREIVVAEGGEGIVCGSVQAARKQIAGPPFDVAVLDNHLPDGKGFNLYFELTKRDPAMTVIVLTGLPELAHAVELTRNGLFDYLAKPIDRENFALAFRRACTRVRHLRSDIQSDDLVGQSAAMREVQSALRQAARHPAATVLITGETGVGKDLAARLLHRWSFAERVPEPPFVAVNCATIPAEMFEAELFGAEKGAYTGAERTREGLVGAVREGTLFLDEIAEVPLSLQAKLLRFLESREYRSLGGTAARRFDGRLVTATNKSLREEVTQGRFREDLLYRLEVFTIHLPPLRERQEEIPLLAESLLAQLGKKYDRSPPRLKPDDVGLLQRYDFPGNVRELRNLLERSLLRTPDDVRWLALDHSWLKSIPVVNTLQSETESPSGEAPSDGSKKTSERALTPIERQEYELIRKTLREERGGIRRTAAKLGLTHQALLRRLQKWPELRETS